ncbi:MAG: TatD family hydrolase, partial [Candidatus Hydrogenedens sp.]
MPVQNNIQIKPIDSHCHLFDEKFNEDREKIITASLEMLEGLVIIIEEPFNISSLSLIKHPKIRYAVGYHPYYSEKVIEGNLETLSSFLHTGYIRAIGEIGLDYYHCKVPKDIQKKAFVQQIEFAHQHNLPIVIHSRNAEKDTYEILCDYYKNVPSIILHCYG